MTAGAAPLDPTTLIGKLRATVGDTRSTEDPGLPQGQELYAIWSDLELEAALAAEGDNILRTAGNLYAGLAASYAAQGRSIKVDTIALDDTDRGPDLLAIARSFYTEAAAAAAAEAADIFIVGAPSSSPSCEISTCLLCSTSCRGWLL